jgi:hypothetical protein
MREGAAEKSKEDRQENIPSAKNPTKDATFRKLNNVCPVVRKKRSSVHVITELFFRIPGKLGLINVENIEKDL